MSSMKSFDPSLQARQDPHYKRNHMGKVTCTLCDICCTDDNNFLKHLSGKTHRIQLERRERNAKKEERLAMEAKMNEEAMRRAKQEKATRDILLQQQSHNNNNNNNNNNNKISSGTFAPFGKPEYHFCTENDPNLFQTKVWLEFYFPQINAGARPLHRWKSAREQEVEIPPNDNFVYLLLACEGYSTIALKFPAKLPRSSAAAPWVSSLHNNKNIHNLIHNNNDINNSNNKDEEEGRYRCTWDPVKKVYSLFFIVG